MGAAANMKLRACKMASDTKSRYLTLPLCQEENVRRSRRDDETFRTPSYLQELLKKSEDNAAMHKMEIIADKYCERGAEWGVGDCSLVGMTQEQKEAFMKVLKQK